MTDISHIVSHIVCAQSDGQPDAWLDERDIRLWDSEDDQRIAYAQLEWDKEQARLADNSAQTFESVFDALKRLIEHTKQAGAARQALFWPGLQVNLSKM